MRRYKRDLRGRFAKVAGSGAARVQRRTAAASQLKRASAIAEKGRPKRRVDFGKAGAFETSISTRSVGARYSKSVPIGRNYAAVAYTGIRFERTTEGPIDQAKKRAQQKVIDRVLKSTNSKMLADQLTKRRPIVVGDNIRVSRSKRGTRQGVRASTTFKKPSANYGIGKLVSSAGRKRRSYVTPGGRTKVQKKTRSAVRYPARPQRRYDSF